MSCEIPKKIKELKKDSDEFLKKFERTTHYTPEEVREWDNVDNNYSYEVGFNDALSTVLKELEGGENE